MKDNDKAVKYIKISTTCCICNKGVFDCAADDVEYTYTKRKEYMFSINLVLRRNLKNESK